MEIAHKLTSCSPTNKQINTFLQLIFLINILTNIVSIFCCKCVSLTSSYEQSYECSRALNRLNILYFEQKSLITSRLLIQWRIGQNDSAHVSRLFVCELNWTSPIVRKCLFYLITFISDCKRTNIISFAMLLICFTAEKLLKKCTNETKIWQYRNTERCVWQLRVSR